MTESSKKMLNLIISRKTAIIEELNCGIISADEAASQIAEMNKKERKILIGMVNKVHVTANGLPRAIAFDKAKNLYSTRLEGKVRITARTKDKLYDKLIEHYGLSITKHNVIDCFEAALKAKMENVSRSPETIRSDRSSFSRFITPELQNMKISDVTGDYLQKYTLDIVKRLNLSVEAFNKYKGILNLIFKYALAEKLIAHNPVDAIINTNYYDKCAVSDYRPEDKIFSSQEILLLQSEIRQQMEKSIYNGYHFNGFTGLLAIETGMRAGELMSLKWSDISDGTIWIHSQQLCTRNEGKRVYTLANWTKNEKHSRKRRTMGRYFPVTDKIQEILDDIHEAQHNLGIKSEFVLCRSDGNWNNSESYEKWLCKTARKLNFRITNNHALRMSLNSNVFIPLGIPVTERARMLGHSVSTNENYYSHALKDNNETLRGILNGSSTPKPEVATWSPLETIPFRTKKIRETL